MGVGVGNESRCNKGGRRGEAESIEYRPYTNKHTCTHSIDAQHHHGGNTSCKSVSGDTVLGSQMVRFKTL